MAITVYAPPGIGDIYWLLMKILPNTIEPVRLKVAASHNFRADFLMEIAGVQSVERANFTPLRLKKLAATKRYKAIESEMYLEANSWLESGKRIEEYLPFLREEFVLNWNHHDDTDAIAAPFLGDKVIALHTSSKHFNAKSELGIGQEWIPEHWVKIVQHIYDEIPDATIVWLGASYDAEMAQLLKDAFPGICIATDLRADVVMKILRNCRGFISYQCGLSVISICEKIPTFMIYYDWLDRIANSFCPKSSIGNDSVYHYDYFSGLALHLEAPALWAKTLV